MAEKSEERIYTVPLRAAFLKVPRVKRANRAVKTIQTFMKRHMKSEDVKVSQKVNEAIWIRGIHHPPSKIKVKAMKDADGVVFVMLPEEKEFPVKKVEKKKEEPKTALQKKAQELSEKMAKNKEEKSERKAAKAQETEAKEEKAADKPAKAKPKKEKDTEKEDEVLDEILEELDQEEKGRPSKK